MKSQLRLRRVRGPRVLLALLLVSLLAVAAPVAALETLEGETITIAADEIVADDLIVTATTLIVDGRVEGDLIFFGQDVTVNGQVDGDFMAAAQAITLNGVVGDDARLGGMSIILGEAALIKDALLAGGLNLTTANGSQVNGEVWFAGLQASLAGAIARDLHIDVNALTLNGQVGGDVIATVSGVADTGAEAFTFIPGAPSMPALTPGLNIGDQARIDGALDYRAPTEAEVTVGQVLGRTFYEALPAEVPAVEAPATTTDWLLGQTRRLVTLFVVGLLMVWLTPRWLKQTTVFLERAPAPGFGWGIVSLAFAAVAVLALLFAMIAVASILGTVTLGNLAFAVVVVGILAIFGLVVLTALCITYGAKIVVSFLAGRLIIARFWPRMNGRLLVPLIVGLVLFVALTAIPYVGGLISFVLTLLGLGAFWMLGRDAFNTWRAGRTETPTPAPKPALRPG